MFVQVFVKNDQDLLLWMTHIIHLLYVYIPSLIDVFVYTKNKQKTFTIINVMFNNSVHFSVTRSFTLKTNSCVQSIHQNLLLLCVSALAHIDINTKIYHIVALDIIKLYIFFFYSTL